MPDSFGEKRKWRRGTPVLGAFRPLSFTIYAFTSSLLKSLSETVSANAEGSVRNRVPSTQEILTRRGTVTDGNLTFETMNVAGTPPTEIERRPTLGDVAVLSQLGKEREERERTPSSGTEMSTRGCNADDCLIDVKVMVLLKVQEVTAEVMLMRGAPFKFIVENETSVSANVPADTETREVARAVISSSMPVSSR